MNDFRIEHDSMGEVRVPSDALWRAQTQRAVENFPISGRPLEPALVHALAHIKAAAAETNADLGVLTAEQAAPSPSRAPRSPTGRTTTSSRSTSSRPARAPAPT